MSFWHILKPSVEACFILLHVSVLACRIREKAHNNSRFSSAFYALYCLQSLFDILFVLMYGVCIGLANFGISLPYVNIGLAFGTYSQMGQAIAHALISYNRFTALVHPHKSNQIWTKKNTAFACVFALALPLPVLVVKWQVQYTLILNPATGGYVYSAAGGIFPTLNGFMAFAYSVSNALISAAFECSTFFAYYKLNRARQQACREDYKLLLYTASQFIGQLMAAFCSSSVVVKAFMDVPYFFALVPHVFHVTVDVLGLSGPVCLLLTSKHVRTSYLAMFCGRAKQSQSSSESRSMTLFTARGSLPNAAG